jgi:hypothetical protein
MFIDALSVLDSLIKIFDFLFFFAEGTDHSDTSQILSCLACDIIQLSSGPCGTEGILIHIMPNYNKGQ